MGKQSSLGEDVQRGAFRTRFYIILCARFTFILYLCIENTKMNNTHNMQRTKILLAAIAITLFATPSAKAQLSWDKAFNKFKMEVRADGEYTTTDTAARPNLGFHGKYFNLKLGGDLGSGFSYYFMQRIVANEGSVTFFDNTDFLYLDYKPTNNWRLRFGKDAMALGGFEYDAAPIDVYFPTNLWRNIYCFQLAFSGAYITDDGNHTFMAQVSNSPYVNYNNLNYDAGLVSYNLYWAGNMGHWHTLWSTSMVEYKWNNYLNMIMIGNKLVYDKWDLYVDFIHHALAIDDWGKNFGIVSCANYYFTPQFNIFVKGMYEQNKSGENLGSSVAMDHQLAAGHTSARYGLGFEYFPSEQKNVRLHIYACRMTDSFTDATTNQPVTVATWNFNVGATWTMDYYQMFKK